MSVLNRKPARPVRPSFLCCAVARAERGAAGRGEPAGAAGDNIRKNARVSLILLRFEVLQEGVPLGAVILPVLQVAIFKS